MRTLILSVVIALMFGGCAGREKKETTYGNGQISQRWYEKHLTPEKVVKDGGQADPCGGLV